MTIKLPKPVATVESWTNGSYWRNYTLNWRVQAETGENLYTEAQLKQAIKDALEEISKDMRAYADSEYVSSIKLSQKPACLGWEYKAEAGKYGHAEHSAHMQANRAFGAHFGIHAALKAATRKLKDQL